MTSIAPLLSGRRVAFVDIWGVLHNGERPYPKAVRACQTYRAAGGTVVLVSNSPRPRGDVAKQLDLVGVATDAYDDIVTSGDVSRDLIASYAGQTVFHLGPERDVGVYEGLNVKCGPIEQSAVVVCTGLFDDEIDTPDDYGPRLKDMLGRGLQMICVNPDIQVERGGRMIYCAGALAALYADLGGTVHLAGKPYPPIYRAAMQLACNHIGGEVASDQVLAIGDGAGTDIEGALANGFDVVYIASRVNMRTDEDLTAATLRLFRNPERRPIAVMAELAW